MRGRGKDLGHTTKFEDVGEGYAKVGGQVFFHGEAVAGGQTLKSLGGGYATITDGTPAGKVLYMGKELASRASGFEHLNGDWSKIHNHENGHTEYIYRGKRYTDKVEAYRAGCPTLKFRVTP